MARPRNEELKEKIRREAWTLFHRVGYDAASFSLIAQACGISRNLVQYHFPKKELLAIDLMNRVLEQASCELGFSQAQPDTAAAAAPALGAGRTEERGAEGGEGRTRDGAEEHPLMPAGDFAAMHAIGSCFFGYFLRDEGWRRFLLDIISSRDLTESVLAFNARWAIDHSGVEMTEELSDKVLRSVIVQMGGFYELLYSRLKSGRPFDAGEELLEVMRAFMRALGLSGSKADEILERRAAGEEQIAQAVERMACALAFE